MVKSIALAPDASRPASLLLSYIPARIRRDGSELSQQGQTVRGALAHGRDVAKLVARRAAIHVVRIRGRVLHAGVELRRQGLHVGKALQQGETERIKMCRVLAKIHRQPSYAFWEKCAFVDLASPRRRSDVVREVASAIGAWGVRRLRAFRGRAAERRRGPAMARARLSALAEQ